MTRQPKAAGVSAVVLTLLLFAFTTLAVAAREPGTRPDPRAVPWEADAAELARTAPEAVEAGSTDESCTGWRSTAFPPPTIRVLRTRGPAEGTVETVDFRTYVGVTFGAEWPRTYPLEVLKAGSIAVMQFGWYYTIVYRGKENTAGECYDVEDNTNDQYFYPEERAPGRRHLRAMELTWHLTLRKFQRSKGTSRLFLTGYRSGTSRICGEDADGWHLYQHSAMRCGEAGMTSEEILRIYYDPNLEIVDRGLHQVLSDRFGDGAHLAPGATDALVPTVHPANKTTVHPATVASFSLDPARTLGVASGDVNGDHLDDLIVASIAGDKSQRVSVALSDGVSYREPATWWEADTGLPNADVRLLAEDFNADGRTDAALLGSGPDAGTAKLLMLRSKPDGIFAPAAVWWTGALDLASSRAFAGDPDGDGRGDLIVRRDLGVDGLEYLVARSSASGLGDLSLWHSAPDLRAATTRDAVGDYDRDGRTDIFLTLPYGDGTKVTVMRSRKNLFKRVLAWTSPASAPVAFGRVKVATSDYDWDGRADLFMYYDRRASGTRVMTLRTTDTGIVAGPSFDDAQMVWETAQPY